MTRELSSTEYETPFIETSVDALALDTRRAKVGPFAWVEGGPLLSVV